MPVYGGSPPISQSILDRLNKKQSEAHRRVEQFHDGKWPRYQIDADYTDKYRSNHKVQKRIINHS